MLKKRSAILQLRNNSSRTPNHYFQGFTRAMMPVPKRIALAGRPMMPSAPLAPSAMAGGEAAMQADAIALWG